MEQGKRESKEKWEGVEAESRACPLVAILQRCTATLGCQDAEMGSKASSEAEEVSWGQ